MCVLLYVCQTGLRKTIVFIALVRTNVLVHYVKPSILLHLVTGRFAKQLYSLHVFDVVFCTILETVCFSICLLDGSSKNIVFIALARTSVWV